jgi:FecR protein
MNDDYLWDGSGEPEPEIRKLEDVLGRFRHQPHWAPDFPDVKAVNLPRLFSPRRLPFWIGAAAAVAFALAGWLSWQHARPIEPTQPEWSVSSLEGTPHVGTKVIRQSGEPGKLAVGQVLETDSRSRASISLDEMGEVQIDPDTRVRLLGAASSRQRLALDRGTIHATIWASPGEFAVDTPSAVAVDLGCAYTLQVDDSGAGLLRTSLGWVGFRSGRRESFIPAGAVCATRPGIGPGTPYYEDASAAFRAALTGFDFESGTAEQRRSKLSTVLAVSRKRDALTLWHLLSRVNGPDRARVYDRLAELVPPPPQVTRDGVMRLDQHMLDLWWSQLGFGDISLWRTWERSWGPQGNSTASAAK